MKSLEGNKFAAAAIIGALVIVVSGFVAEYIFPHQNSEKQAYPIDGVAVEGSASAAPLVLAPISPLLAKANAASGEVVAKKCLSCHTFTAGGPNSTGPNLHGIVDHATASIAGFAYSEALKGVPNKTWDVESLSKFLHKPSAYAKGTKMSFAGIKSDAERADLIKYLQTLK